MNRPGECGGARRTPHWETEDVRAFRDAVRRFVAAEVTPHQARWAEQRRVDRELWRRAGRLGLMLADLPETYGGGGGSFAHVAVLMEELAYAGDYGFGVSVQQIVARYVLNHGREEQRRLLLPRLASGELVAAIAMTEPGTGSDLRAIRTRAEATGDRYRISGSKTFISNGSSADLILVAARTKGRDATDGLSLIFVETADTPGFAVSRVLDKLGQHAADTSELFFEDVEVPRSNLLGEEEGRGLKQLMAELPYERVLCAVTAIAGIEAALSMTVEHARTRRTFGRPLLEHQHLRFRIADVQVAATVGRILLDECVRRSVDGTVDAETAATAKLWSTETLGRVVDECLQVFGGYGYMREYPIARLYADARVQRIYGGSSEMMREIVARAIERKG